MNRATHHDFAPAYDEIDLVDLWLIFKRYQLHFWATFLVVALAGAIIAFLLPAKYNYTATLEIGGLRTQAGIDPVTTPQALTAALDNAYIPAATRDYLAASPQQTAPQVTAKIPEGNKEGRLIVLQAQAGMAQSGQVSGLLNAIVSRVQTVHSGQLSTQLQTELAALQTEIAALQQYQERLITVQQAMDTSQAAVAAMLNTQLAAISQQLARLQGQLQRLSTTGLQPTHLLGDITRSLQPSSLGTMVLILLAGVLAAFAGLAVVFVSAFLAHAKDRQAENIRYAENRQTEPSVAVKSPRKHNIRRVATL